MKLSPNWLTLTSFQRQEMTYFLEPIRKLGFGSGLEQLQGGFRISSYVVFSVCVERADNVQHTHTDLFGCLKPLECSLAFATTGNLICWYRGYLNCLGLWLC